MKKTVEALPASEILFEIGKLIGSAESMEHRSMAQGLKLVAAYIERAEEEHLRVKKRLHDAFVVVFVEEDDDSEHEQLINMWQDWENEDEAAGRPMMELTMPAKPVHLLMGDGPTESDTVGDEYAACGFDDGESNNEFSKHHEQVTCADCLKYIEEQKSKGLNHVA